MPTIIVIDGIRVFINYRDHAPPHFHAEHGEHEVLVSIGDLTILAGGLPGPQMKKLMAWAGDNQRELALHWVRMVERPE